MKLRDKLKLEENQHKKALRTIGLLNNDINHIFEEIESFIKRTEGENGLVTSSGLRRVLSKLKTTHNPTCKNKEVKKNE